MRNKKIVVTGGAGFLGSHVVSLLVQTDNDVIIIDDFSNGKMLHLEQVKIHPNLKIVRGDISNIDDVRSAFKGCSIVIHLAVLGLRQSIKDPYRVNEVIVNGTLNCLEVAREYKMELFLNCSSSEAYGTAQYVPMDERHPLNPETPYAAAKVAQDMYVSSFGRTFDLKWTTIRPFNMYGSNSHWQGYRGELIPKMIVRAMNRKPLIIFGDGNQTRDFVFVEDAAHAIVLSAENSHCIGQNLNFCSGVETPVRKIAELICKAFHLNPQEFIQSQSPRPGEVLRHLGDNSKFIDLVGFEPKIGIEEGIRKTVAWFKTLPFDPKELLRQEVLRGWE